ncbi:MAG: YdcF family protein [Chloroflexota bacterium]|nr:YdcF family protein [Chloroflexota bacterium]
MPRLFPLALAGLLGAVALLWAPGFLLEGPQCPLERSDAIIVISGDEDLARFREGLRLYQAGWAPVLIFSGAARDHHESNAEVMRKMAVDNGVPPAAILTDHLGGDTYGNAVHTRALMQQHKLGSAILVTSPYHLHRAALTFNGVYNGSGIRVIGRSAPDGAWRKQSWWLRDETRELTIRELEKLAYVALTGRFN